MFYLVQIIKMLNKEQRTLFIGLFDDLSFEIEEMGYEGMEGELINDMLMNHFGIEIYDMNQLDMFTACILKHQGRIENAVRGVCLMVNDKYVA